MNVSEHIAFFVQEMERRNFRKNTIKNYADYAKLFFIKSEKCHPKNINETDIRNFLSQIKTPNTQRAYHSAIKKFFEICLGQKNKFKFIPYCRKEKKLPIILSVDEIQRIFNVIKNLKHRAVFSVLYSTGVRISELLNIRLSDIDRANMLIHITDGKGGKQRQVTLKLSVLKMIENYYREYKPKEFLFQGQFGGKYSERSINSFIKNYSRQAKITKRVYAHLIRHCTGTHLAEGGVQLGIIQRSFGHASPKTTMIYQHISPNVISEMYSPIQRIRL